MVARCSAPPGLQSGANALRLPLDSFRPTFIGAEGDTPNKIWAATLQAIPPIGTPLAYFGHQGLPVPMLSRTGGGGVDTFLIHPHLPTNLGTLLCHPPPFPHARLPYRGLVPPGGGLHPVGPPPSTGLAALGILDSALHAFVLALQVVVAARVGAAVPSPYPSDLTGKVAVISLLRL